MLTVILFVVNAKTARGSMSTGDFIIEVFCIIDDEVKNLLSNLKLRQRGRIPNLSDSEVMTMEIVGEFLGFDSDKSIWEYFKTHWLHFFPRIPDRSNFARQAAHLHVVKRILQEKLASTLGALSDPLHIIDGFPIPVCKLSRAYSTSVFKGNASYGYCAAKKERYYGFRGHMVVNSTGVITSATFCAANVDERDVCPELTEKIRGLLLGDKGYIRPELQEELNGRGLDLQTPLKSNMQDNRSKKWIAWIKRKRRLIETVIGQLTERFNIEKVRARDVWHKASRFWRKLLAHTVCVKINMKRGNVPLQLEQILA